MREAIAIQADDHQAATDSPSWACTPAKSIPREPSPRVPVSREHLTPVELERLTGIAEERLRSWARRFSYPTVRAGRRRYLASEVPGLIATKQLVGSGLPVAAAIDEARRRAAQPHDLSALREAFDGLDVAVAGFQTGDPAATPLQRVYVNREAGQRFPRLGEVTTRALLRMASHDLDPKVVWIDSAGAGDEEHEALAFTIGAPTYSPALVVLMELPEGGRGVRSRDDQLRQQATERATANGLARARRQLQLQPKAAGLRPAFEAICAGVGAVDGFVAFRYGAALQGSLSLRGRMLPSRIPPHVADAIDATALGDCPAWLERSTVEALGGEGACLAIPLSVAGRELGYACLEFDGPTLLSPGTQEMLMGFGAMQAAVMVRERR